MEVFNGFAKFDGDGNCIVNEVKLSAKNVLIATGGYPIVPDIPGLLFFVDGLSIHNLSSLFKLLLQHFIID